MRLTAAALVLAALAAAQVEREMADVAPIAEIRIEGMPDWQAITGDAVWVSNGPGNTVHRIDPATNQVVATVTVGKQPCSGLAAGFGSIWSPSCGERALVRVDTETNRVVARIPVGAADKEGGVASGGGSVWLVSDASGILSRIDPRTNRVAAEIHVPAGSAACIFAEGAVWVTTPADNSLTRVDPNGGETNRIAVGHGPRFLTSGAGAIWTLNQGDGTVTRVDAKSGRVTATVNAGVAGTGGDIAFGNGHVWVSVPRVPLSEIDPDTNRLVRQWTGGGGDAVRIGHGSIWLSNVLEQNIWRIDLKKL